MNFFAFDIRKALLVLFIAALPLISINMQRNPEEEPWYRKPFTYSVSFVQDAYSTFTSGVRGTTSLYLKLVGIKKDLADLRKENEEMRAQLAAMTELKLENERLNRLLDFKQKTKMELLAAKVIARDLNSDHYAIRINRGTNHGLKKLQAVITVEGVVGYIFNPEPTTSQVLVLTDRNCSIDAIVQRTRARGLFSGKTNTSGRLRYLERADDVSVGDMIVTSGLQGFFPKGFPIGRITSVKRTEYGISQEATVAPVVNPANLEEVFIITNSNNEDFQPAEEAEGLTQGPDGAGAPAAGQQTSASTKPLPAAPLSASPGNAPTTTAAASNETLEKKPELPKKPTEGVPQ